jgi:hypothetical protein
LKKNIIYGNRKIERPSGLLIIIISFLVIASILTQLEVKPSFSDILDNISFLNENIMRLKINAFIWLLNSVLIIILGPAILITFLPYRKTFPYSIAFLVSATGIIYLFYTTTCFNIISIISAYDSSQQNESNMVPSLALSMLINKTNLQLVAYTLTGICAVLLGIFIMWTGYLPRLIGLMAIAGGLIYIVFDWLDPDSLAFSAGRVIFIVSLMLFGIFLLLRGTRSKKNDTIGPPKP